MKPFPLGITWGCNNQGKGSFRDETYGVVKKSGYIQGLLHKDEMYREISYQYHRSELTKAGYFHRNVI
jgi:hypothetical protein